MTAQPHPSHHVLLRLASLEEKISAIDLLQEKVEKCQLICEQRHLQTHVPSENVNNYRHDKGRSLAKEMDNNKDLEIKNAKLDKLIEAPSQELVNVEISNKLQETIKELEEEVKHLKMELNDRANYIVALETSNNSFQISVEVLSKKLVVEQKCNKELELKYLKEKSDLEDSLERSRKMYEDLEARCRELDVAGGRKSQKNASSKDHRETIPARVEELFTYLKNGNEAEVKSIIATGANVNIVDEMGKTTLHYAAQYGHVTLCDLLLDKGVYINTADFQGNLPLHLACSKGHISVVRLLMSRGASVKSRGPGDSTMLHHAAKYGHATLCQYLLDKGASANAVDGRHATPLHVACYEGHLAVVCILISWNASVACRDLDKRTPLHYAAEYGHLQICYNLLHMGADVNAVDIWNTTPLHQACYNGHDLVVKRLVSKGARVDLCDSYNRTPLHYAKQNCHRDIYDFLQSIRENENLDLVH